MTASILLSIVEDKEIQNNTYKLSILHWNAENIVMWNFLIVVEVKNVSAISAHSEINVFHVITHDKVMLWISLWATRIGIFCSALWTIRENAQLPVGESSKITIYIFVLIVRYSFLNKCYISGFFLLLNICFKIIQNKTETLLSSFFKCLHTRKLGVNEKNDLNK